LPPNRSSEPVGERRETAFMAPGTRSSSPGDVVSLQTEMLRGVEEMAVAAEDLRKSISTRALEVDGIAGANIGIRWKATERATDSFENILGEREPVPYSLPLVCSELTMDDGIGRFLDRMLPKLAMEGGYELQPAKLTACNLSPLRGEPPHRLRSVLLHIAFQKIGGVEVNHQDRSLSSERMSVESPFCRLSAANSGRSFRRENDSPISSRAYGTRVAIGVPRSVTMSFFSRETLRTHFPVSMWSSRMVILFMCTM